MGVYGHFILRNILPWMKKKITNLLSMIVYGVCSDVYVAW